MLDLTSENNGVLLPVKIVPGATRTRYLGIWDGRARIAVAAPPEKGKANKAVVAFLAKMFGVRRSDVAVVSGHFSPQKKIRIGRVTEATVRAALEPEQS